MDTTTAMLAAALEYAARGWPVFPCRPGQKTPATAHGLQDATCQPDQIRRWWARWPEANVAVATGHISGIVAIDIDGETGEATLDMLVAEHGPLPKTLTAITGGDGLHYLYRPPADRTMRNTAGRIGPGIDTRGDGGYIIVAPSVHPSGQGYEWIDPAALVAVLPGWLAVLADPPAPAHPTAERAPAPPLVGGMTGYAAAALERRAAEVAAAPPGERNHTLNQAAFRCGQLVAGGQLAETDAVATLTAAALTCGLDGREIAQTVRSGLTAGGRSPQYPDPTRTTTRTAGPARNVEPPPPPDQDEEPAGDVGPDRAPNNCTDLGNARRLCATYGPTTRYVPQWGAWLTWQDTRWERDTTGEIYRRAKHAAEAIWTEALAHPDHEQRKELLKWALRSEGEPRLKAMVELARTEPGIPVEPAQLDTDPWALNVANGTIDLTTGRLRPHDPAEMITKLAPVTYDPDATSPVWDRFLADATGGDQALAAFLARAVGYSLTGSTREEVLFFAHGPAATGKSTFVDAIEATLGDYSRRADFETFLARPGDGGGARGDIARLAGARFVNSVEVDEGKKLAEGLVKTLTGGDLITARFLYRDEFEFRPQFKLWLAANAAPKIRHGDDGIWRRILRIPFAHVVPTAARDPHVKQALRDPAVGGPAVLAWAVNGCTRWQADGLQIPDTIRAATSAYRADMDPLGDFLTEHCQFDRDAWTVKVEVHDRYEEWAKEQGLRHTVSPRAFKQILEEHGCWAERQRIGGKQWHGWRGIRLLDAEERDAQTLDDYAETLSGEVSQVSQVESPTLGFLYSAGAGERDRETGDSPHSPDSPPRTDLGAVVGDSADTGLVVTQCERCGRRVVPAPGAAEHGWKTICSDCEVY